MKHLASAHHSIWHLVKNSKNVRVDDNDESDCVCRLRMTED